MELSLRLSALRFRFRQYLGRHETALEAFRLTRYWLIQGPWQAWYVRRCQRTNPNAPIATFPETLFSEVDVADAVRRLERDAYTLRFGVPKPLVAEIVDYARADGAKRIDDSHVRCPAVRRIAHDPRVVQIAREYLGAEPVLFNSRLYWTLPFPDERGRVAAPAEAGRFHYDVADVRALTLFVYLTDVDAQSGPHIVVRGTHGRRSLSQVFRRFLPDEVVARRFGERIEVILGESGTSWFEDITCFHKQALGTKVRLMLALIYSLRRRAEAEIRPSLGASQMAAAS
jgi:hypothetical protein